ncbi:hypothetical protein [Azospirillum griseum]|uniref:Uncharacterized protein n=1 Tax=Azospirillum griseum TaxID=2496639 RepID=A0A431VIE3_9PROT|nr:hypothetical protein [Azospirillum griseum]RTR20650.1 hypothetical protein EJ903_11090 [Azospirillum griseum]
MAVMTVILVGLVAVNAWAIWIAANRRGLVQAYWALSGSFMGIGLMGALGILFLTPIVERDTPGPISGEMPPAFGLGLGLIALGLSGVVLGAVLMLLTRLWRKRKAAQAANATGNGVDDTTDAAQPDGPHRA